MSVAPMKVTLRHCRDSHNHCSLTLGWGKENRLELRFEVEEFGTMSQFYQHESDAHSDFRWMKETYMSEWATDSEL